MARKILLADDSVTAQNMGRKILADAGYEVTTVNNGSAALKRIGEQRPDLIVLDVYMPGYSGLEVCQRLKEAGDTSRIPVLLTVGKLEPFKPEEAKRVRADAFIVKPFEASELLSALSKLEDKIVPRAESSKPGRLARATAAIEEGQRDKAMAVEEDSGWKNRISFPSKKKEKAVEEEAEDSAIYNPVNKDLRTVVEPRASVESKPKEKEHVDLGALAPEGLPKDVTPEEIAALASAAAQIQGKVLESKTAEQREEIPVAAPAEAKTETAEIPQATQPAAVESTPSPAAESTSAAQTAQEKIAAPASSLQDAPTEAAPVAETKPAETLTAAAETRSESEKAPAANSADETGSHEASEPADVPVTMAAAAGADSGRSHWTAVAVALAPEDVGISLEQEMQKSYAAFAAAGSDHTEAVSTIPAIESNIATEPSSSINTSTTETSTLETSSPEAAQPVPAAVPEAPQTFSEVASVASGTVPSVVKEFETVAASYVAAEGDSAPADSSSSTPAIVDAVVEQPPAIAAPTIAKEPEQAAGETPAQVEAEVQQPAPEELKEDREEELKTPEAETRTLAEVPVATAETQPSTEQTATDQNSYDKTSLPSASTQNDGDHIAATAAAWASWRRIRETGDANASLKENSPSQDAAAMAVAAGAEKSQSPEGTGIESDPAIASIVDSVLADLRPKIVEEISRKLGKK